MRIDQPAGGAIRLGPRAAARLELFVAGALCLIGLIGPAVGNLNWRMVGVAGYRLVFPLTCFAIGLVFGRSVAISRGAD